MENLIKETLDKYNTSRKKIGNMELAKLIVAHMKVNGGWHLNLNSNDGQYENAKEFIKEFGG
tara:strand:- start:704 stop:889 length:186 start_codon:yes stop_codon:yes gene_type:complete